MRVYASSMNKMPPSADSMTSDVFHRITQVGRIRAGNERICIMLINNNIANSVEEIYLIAK